MLGVFKVTNLDPTVKLVVSKRYVEHRFCEELATHNGESVNVLPCSLFRKEGNDIY